MSHQEFCSYADKLHPNGHNLNRVDLVLLKIQRVCLLVNLRTKEQKLDIASLSRNFNFTKRCAHRVCIRREYGRIRD